MSQVYYLTYISRMSLVAGLRANVFSDINTVAQHQNPLHQITGFLCFGNGYFFQYIEGNKQDILQLFNNIQRDYRNHHVMLMSEGTKDRRLFSDWKMLMVNVNNPDTLEDITNTFRPMLPGVSKQEQSDKLVKIMQSQYDQRHIINFDDYS